MKFAIFGLASMLAAAHPAMAGPCDDLARLAKANGGVWPQTERLPQKATEDGPWAYADTGHGDAPTTFRPHFQADRQRLLGEARAVAPKEFDLISSYLSPTPQAFDASAKNGEIDYLNVHRWPGAPFFAVAAHDMAVSCETDWAFFYTGADGKSHVANPVGLSPCDSPASGVWPGMAMIHAGPDWAVMNAIRSDDAIEGDADLTQDIAVWTGAAFAPACTLSYHHHIGYKISDQTRFEDEHGGLRPPTAADGWLRAHALRLVPDYLKRVNLERAIRQLKLKYKDEQARLYQAQMTAINTYAGLDLLKARKLSSAYHALRMQHISGAVIPVTVGPDDDFVVFTQTYSHNGPADPYTDVRLYAADWNKAEYRAAAVLEIQRGRLYKVDAALDKPPAQ